MKAQRPNRETPSTIKKDGSRAFLQPADVSGRFTTWRRVFAVFLVGIYVSLPWIPINGYPAVFLDVINRRFHLFGLTFVAQDLWITFFLISGLGFSLFFITSLFGRIWCGWACPHSVFLEQVFRPIERLIEGDGHARKQLDKREWDTDKIIRRAVKYFIFAILSALIAHLFLAYFISIPELYRWMTTSPTEHWGAFIFMAVATALIYFNFTWFREQLCLIICPYGRLQSALIDDDSLIIGYDEGRGEPRGSAKKEGFGDCIDCMRCVQVCPTGIDIRQGLQMECIGCANCIDACNTIMDKLHRPQGLIRYDSLSGLAGKTRRFIRPRIFIYAALMLAGAVAFTLSALQLRDANMNVVRMTGSPYYLTESGLRNQYMVRVINKTNQERTFQLVTAAESQAFSVEGTLTGIKVPPMNEVVSPVVISLRNSDYTGPFQLNFTLIDPDGQTILKRNVEFIGPDPKYIREKSNL
jgi:cytochrome c oxidase accessory protein FixG